jgi:hypothetical protein
MVKQDAKYLNSVTRTSKKHKIAAPNSRTNKTKKDHGKVSNTRERDASDTTDVESAITTTSSTSTTTAVETAAAAMQHEFVTNALDHCETPRIAYEHILEAVLLELGGDNDDNDKKKMTTMRIWDPYYCDGATKRHLQALGFKNVIHENKDFYKLIEHEATIPDHDVFLTNPPYSDDHIERLLTFLNNNTNHDDNNVSSSTPFCLLLPNWVARKKEYKTLLSHKTVFYVSPLEPYGYRMPSWNTHHRPEHVGEDGRTTPYLSSWYVHAGTRTEALVTKLLHQQQEQRKNPQGRGWVVARTIKGLKWNIQKQKQR